MSYTPERTDRRPAANPPSEDSSSQPTVHLGPAAGWYANPRGGHELRYWDGHAWTQWARSKGILVFDPLRDGDPTVKDTTAVAGGSDTSEREGDAGERGSGQHIRSGPQVFLSYRRSDTGTLAADLSTRLRDDLGGANVFRDEEDLIAGERWQDVLDSKLSRSDATIFLVGNDWTGPAGNGARRIDDPADVVRREVRQVLGRNASCAPLPILVGIAAPPENLPADVSPLFEDHHWVRATPEDLVRRRSADYQKVLVGVWDALRRQVTNGVLVIGDMEAMAPIDDLVSELKASDLIDAEQLSRFASGACVISARRLRKGARKWPDVIIIAAEDEPSSVLRARIAAVSEHPGITSVALFGAGAAAGLAASQTLAAANTTFTAPTSLSGVLPSGGSGPLGSASTAWSGAGTGAKAAVLAAAATIVGVGGVVAANLIDPDPAHALDYAASTTLESQVEDDRAYPLGDPEEVVVTLGDPVDVEGSGEADLVSHSVAVTFGDVDESVELGEVVLPKTLPGDWTDDQADGEVGVETITGEAELTTSEIPSSSFCYDTSDPSRVVGGWVYEDGAPAQIAVSFGASIVDGTVQSGIMQVSLTAPAERQLIPDLDEGFNLDRCPESQAAATSWTSES